MKPWTLLFSLPLFLLACGEKGNAVDPLTTDDDGDGFSEEDGDCNDANPDIKPFADEICDFYDNDCDGLTDDEDDSLIANSRTTFYLDKDHDGYGDNDVSVAACLAPAEHIVENGDCDDSDATINPDGTEICDGMDNDCDGFTDDEDDSLNGSTGTMFYMDADGDGEGSAGASIMACAVPDGYSALNTDCNDSAEDLDGDGEADGADFNNLDEDNDGLTTCGEDTDGDGQVDIRDCADRTAAVGARDNDGDGFISCINDCNDNDVYTHPGAGFNEADTTACMTDVDGDGFGDPAPAANVIAGTDCDDNDVFKNKADIDGDGLTTCDGDCDDSDEEIGIEDNDGDGYSACDGDCDDNNPHAYPGAAFNEPDIDGDGEIDCSTDNDQDGWAGFGTFSCYEFTLFDSWGDGWNGNAIEIYENGVMVRSIANQNLDGVSNIGVGEFSYDSYCPSAGTTTIDFYFKDGSYNSEVYFEMYDDTGALILEGQGSGSSDLIVNNVTFTNGDIIYSAERQQGTDCDDNDASTIGDNDGDGFTFCTTDCDDNDATVNPDGVEVYYDGIDQNCDGASDFDQDGDGVDAYEAYCNGTGDLSNSCDFDGDGVVDWRGGRDCDDMDDSTTGDDDNDGFLVCGSDCDDTKSAIHPGAPEIYYDGIDQNCIAGDEFDQDGDGDESMEHSGTCSDATLSTMTACLSPGTCSDGTSMTLAACTTAAATWTLDNTWTANGFDCDDTSAGLTGLDADGDGFTSCPNADGLSDCDDDSSVTYPGIAINESSYDANDISTHFCATDADGDGYAASPAYGCYIIYMTDEYGDGWNGSALEVYEDGVYTNATFTNLNVKNGFYTPETEMDSYCPTGGLVEFVFVSGEFVDEVSFEIYLDDGAEGILVAEGMGAANGSLTVNSINFLDGETVYSEIWGSDSNDGDASVH